VSWDITTSALHEAVVRAAAGETADLATRRRARRVAASRVQADVQLSAREMTVLELIGTGLTNQEIADRLYLSINSIKSYIRTAYRKIGVSRRAQAVLWAVHEQTAP
jgi:NarL family two-component system response regulator LiaR